MALMLFILASAAFLSALLAMRFAIQGREVAMPNVVGKKAVEAQEMLQGRGVEFRVEDHIYSPLPVDEVVRQSHPRIQSEGGAVRSCGTEPGAAEGNDSFA